MNPVKLADPTVDYIIESPQITQSDCEVMSGKKVIAICQFGGEFVSEEDGCLTYKGGDAHAMEVDDKMKYEDFKAELVEMFNCDIDTVSIKYFLPGNKKTPITISNKKDLKRMINFHTKSTNADIYILREEVIAPVLSDMPLSRLSQTPFSEEAGDLINDAPVEAVDNPTEAVVNPIEAVDNSTEHVDLFDSSFAIIDGTTNVVNDIQIPTFAQSLPPLPMDENQIRAAQQWQNSIIGVGQRFNSVHIFREAVRKYAMANHFAVKLKKNDSNRVTVKCKAEGCSWRIHASRLATTQLFSIRKMNGTHTCEGSAAAGHQATRSWVASLIKERLRADPSYKPKDIVSDIKQEFGVQLNYVQAWRGKEIAKEQLQGSYKDAYKKLPIFCGKIMETNPSSFATFTTKHDSSFQGVFVSFHASLSGFRQGCRPLLFLDSIPLKSKYEGMLFVASAADGNDDVFPVAFAIVDLETNDNWHWFLLQLKTALSSSHGLTIVADREKGLKEAIAEIFNDVGVHHGYCIHYLSEQFIRDLKMQYSHEVKRLMVEDFVAAAYAAKPAAFLHHLESIKNVSLEAYNWIMQSEPAHWANAYFPGARYNHLTSNFGELFYNWASEAHELPIIQMIEVFRGKITELFYTRRNESNQWLTILTPSMEELLKKEGSKVATLQVLISLGNRFEVRGESTELVDMDQWDCSCKGWQLSGLPCCHAIAVIGCLRHNTYDYCSRYLTRDSYRLTYSENIHPVPIIEGPLKKDLSQMVANVTPPPTRRPPGRPSTKRSSQEMVKRQLQCSRCKGAGHNKSSCKEFLLEG